MALTYDSVAQSSPPPCLVPTLYLFFSHFPAAPSVLPAPLPLSPFKNLLAPSSHGHRYLDDNPLNPLNSSDMSPEVDMKAAGGGCFEAGAGTLATCVGLFMFSSPIPAVAVAVLDVLKEMLSSRRRPGCLEGASSLEFSTPIGVGMHSRLNLALLKSYLSPPRPHTSHSHSRISSHIPLFFLPRVASFPLNPLVNQYTSNDTRHGIPKAKDQDSLRGFAHPPAPLIGSSSSSRGRRRAGRTNRHPAPCLPRAGASGAAPGAPGAPCAQPLRVQVRVRVHPASPLSLSSYLAPAPWACESALRHEAGVLDAELDAPELGHHTRKTTSRPACPAPALQLLVLLVFLVLSPCGCGCGYECQLEPVIWFFAQPPSSLTPASEQVLALAPDHPGQAKKKTALVQLRATAYSRRPRPPRPGLPACSLQLIDAV
ncbi:hypothetical protein GALMADRAFT_145538 [Galerina marginata CBS 339.88]|uniref:Uncharacterized protein n=1 Tax=Galerina marginata (strain CBS 339.88) TaxID=685588 RepID=A0A067SF40_GALM3|nr:hypothetical protein GALMADRAFT_145538 [Galerina marginata CBS 339.88]